MTRRVALAQPGTIPNSRTNAGLNASSKDWRIQRAIESLQQNPRLRACEIAASLNLSKSRFRHLFTIELGISPRQYLRRLRLEHARALLEGSSLSVKEITAQINVKDASHFFRDYKALFGHTPRQTRDMRISLQPPGP